MKKDNKNVFKYVVAILIFIAVIFTIVRFTSLNNINNVSNEANTGGLFNFISKTSEPVVKKSLDQISSEEEFNNIYGVHAEAIKKFVIDNKLITSGLDKELDAYGKYALSEVKRYLEDNKDEILKRVENGEKIILVRESTDGQLIPGNIYEEDPSQHFLDKKKCAWKYSVTANGNGHIQVQGQHKAGFLNWEVKTIFDFYDS